MQISRRTLLKRSASALLAAGLWPGVLAAKGKCPGTTFSFLVVNDLHVLNAKCHPWLEGLVRQMKTHEGVDFCVIDGDLSEDGKAAQLDPVKRIFEGLGKPVHVTVGNHDHDSPRGRKDFEALYANQINHHFNHEGWQFLCLDSSEGQLGSVTIQPTTMRFVEDQLAKLDKVRPLVVFTHFPLGAMVPNRVRNADKFLTLFKEHNLQAVYSGHFHGYSQRKAGQTVLTTNKCCSFSRNNHDGTKDKGYFLCKAVDGQIERRFVEFKL